MPGTPGGTNGRGRRALIAAAEYHPADAKRWEEQQISAAVKSLAGARSILRWKEKRPRPRLQFIPHSSVLHLRENARASPLRLRAERQGSCSSLQQRLHEKVERGRLSLVPGAGWAAAEGGGSHGLCWIY